MASSSTTSPAPPTTAAVIATAGHVDHGKTALVFALTGMESDRLPEERARGISIELGFAWMDRPAGRIAVIDVPGHERFVRQMVAGASGIDAVILVVAADEGVMPQTREHLDICELLGIRTGLVALTRSDLADPELMSLAREDVEAAVAKTFLAGRPIVPFSIHDPEAPGRLLRALDDVIATLERRDARDRPFLLAIDRAFSRPGFGTIVTGTARSGELAAGDEVVLYHPRLAPITARVRGLERHGHPVPRAAAGQRVALNLAAVTHELPRGTRVAHPGAGELTPCSMWDVRFATRASAAVEVRDGEKGLACFGASVVEASLTFVEREPSPATAGGALAQLRLAEPLALLPGERWIFRGFQTSIEGATLGGGVVLAPSPRRRRRGRRADLEELGALAGHDVERALSSFVAAHGEQGVARTHLHAALPWSRADIDHALAKSSLIVTSQPGGEGSRSTERPSPGGRAARVVSPAALASLTAALEALLAAHHRDDPSSPGLALEELRTRVRPQADATAFTAFIDALTERRRLRREDGHVALAAFSPSVSDADAALDDAVLTLLNAAALSPPRVDELTVALTQAGTRCDRPAVDKALVRLVARGDVVRVAKDLALSAAAVERFVATVRDYFDDNEWLDAQALKHLTGLSRKWLIPLAEWLDRARVTVRVGDRRRLRR